MLDPRITALADNLVNYSVAVKPGDKVLIESYETDTPLVTELIKAVYKAGGLPYVELFDGKVQRALLNGADENYLNNLAKYALFRMSDMQCYIGVRGAKNSFETSDVDSKKMELYSRLYSYPVHHDSRVGKTRWVILRYPNESMSQLAGRSTEQFEDFYFKVCNLDYSKMDRAMDNLQSLMNKTDRVRLVAPNTDLTFSIKGIGSKKCSGHMNIPDGEVYSAPVKNSVNGVIAYNTPSIHQGTKFENISLKFKDGKIVEATGSYPDKLKTIFDTDEGARYVGEFAIGVNPYITEPMGDILFDEKISGSIHFTPGSCYDDADNGNRSAVHWDLVLIQTPEYGGGQIWFDNRLIRENGRFVIKELECLNPENLK
ncbi:MAG: aminopeptidase [Clostridiales bacterium]|jgi:aminopeptidase|nr:aminopeptidase [Clostridiales bacterium]